MLTHKGTAVQESLSTSATLASVTVERGESLIVCAMFNDPLVGTIPDSVKWGASDLTEDASYNTISGLYVAIWRLYNSGATDTRNIVFTLSGALVGFGFVASTIRGQLASPVDKTAAAEGSSTAPDSGNTATTSQANEILIGAVGTIGHASDAAGNWLNSFTAGQRAGTATSATPCTISEGYREVSATGAYKAAKDSITSREWGAIIHTYKLAAPVNVTLTVASATGEAQACLAAVAAFSVALGLAAATAEARPLSSSAGPISATIGLAAATAEANAVGFTRPVGVTVFIFPATGFAEALPVVAEALTHYPTGRVLPPNMFPVGFAGYTPRPAPLPGYTAIPSPSSNYVILSPAATPGYFGLQDPPEFLMKKIASKGIRSYGHPYFSMVSPSHRNIPLGNFRQRLVLYFTLEQLPVRNASDDERHVIFSYQRTTPTPADVFAIALTPNGRIVGIQEGVADLVTPINVVSAGIDTYRVAYEFGPDVNGANRARRIVLNETVIVERAPIGATQSANEDEDRRVMLFNGITGLSRVACTVYHMQVYGEPPFE